MSDDLQRRVDVLEGQVEGIIANQKEDGERVDALERSYVKLTADISEAKVKLAEVTVKIESLATREGVESVRREVVMGDSRILEKLEAGLMAQQRDHAQQLRDALAAVPAKAVVLWTAIGAGVSALGFFAIHH